MCSVAGFAFSSTWSIGNRFIRPESMVGSPWLKHPARATCSSEGYRAHSRTGQNPYERNQRRVPSSEPHPLRTRGISPSSQSTRQQPYRAESMVGSARSKHRPAPRARPRGAHGAHSRTGHNLYERNQLWVVTPTRHVLPRGTPPSSRSIRKHPFRNHPFPNGHRQKPREPHSGCLSGGN